MLPAKPIFLRNHLEVPPGLGLDLNHKILPGKQG